MKILATRFTAILFVVEANIETFIGVDIEILDDTQGVVVFKLMGSCLPLSESKLL